MHLVASSCRKMEEVKANRMLLINPQEQDCLGHHLKGRERTEVWVVNKWEVIHFPVVDFQDKVDSCLRIIWDKWEAMEVTEVRWAR